MDASLQPPRIFDKRTRFFQQALKDEFDQLSEEGAHRRRMMVVSLHDRISGHASRVPVLDRFLNYARSKPGVWFARKDEIARWALKSRSETPIVDRAAPAVTGLPGSAVAKGLASQGAAGAAAQTMARVERRTASGAPRRHCLACRRAGRGSFRLRRRRAR